MMCIVYTVESQILKTHKNKCWEKVEKRTFLYCWWECTLLIDLREQRRESWKKLHHPRPGNPVCICPEKNNYSKAHMHSMPLGIYKYDVESTVTIKEKIAKTSPMTSERIQSEAVPSLSRKSSDHRNRNLRSPHCSDTLTSELFRKPTKNITWS